MKKKRQFKVVTLCDFGDSNRSDVIASHYTFASAGRMYPKLWDIYGRRYGWRVWQEVV